VRRGNVKRISEKMQRVSLSLEMRLSKLRRAWWILSYIKLQIPMRHAKRKIILRKCSRAKVYNEKKVEIFVNEICNANIFA